jgi:RNA polymerase sigma factor (sigma-70 family)
MGILMSTGEFALRDQVGSLYSDHHGWLYAWLRARLGCGHRAADLAQDTFMRLLARDEAIAIAEPRAFLTTVARRVLSNHWRREELEKAYLEALALRPEEFAISPEQQALLMETLLEIDQLLNGLPLPVKRAFFHAQLDGMTHPQIAAELGISISTVKRYLVQAGMQCYFAAPQDPA